MDLVRNISICGERLYCEECNQIPDYYVKMGSYYGCICSQCDFNLEARKKFEIEKKEQARKDLETLGRVCL